MEVSGQQSDGSERSRPNPCRFTPIKNPGTNRIERRVGPGAGMDFGWDLNLSSPSLQQYLSDYYI